MHGVNHLPEAVRQLRGTACNQVAGRRGRVRVRRDQRPVGRGAARSRPVSDAARGPIRRTPTTRASGPRCATGELRIQRCAVVRRRSAIRPGPVCAHCGATEREWRGGRPARARCGRSRSSTRRRCPRSPTARPTARSSCGSTRACSSSATSSTARSTSSRSACAVELALTRVAAGTDAGGDFVLPLFRRTARRSPPVMFSSGVIGFQLPSRPGSSESYAWSRQLSSAEYLPACSDEYGPEPRFVDRVRSGRRCSPSWCC